MNEPRPLLEVTDLCVTFPAETGVLTAVDRISFHVGRGERVGLAGESGSGKTVTAMAIMGLVRTPPATVSGSVVFDGQELVGMRERAWQRIRGARIAMIFQNPLGTLNPAMTIGDQIAETILAHEDVSKKHAHRRAIDLLGRVGIPAAERNAAEYPHRFSGGMRQRVMIAIALSCEPDLVIADEPTTALDVTIQGQILELLVSICEESATSMVFITHDLGIMAGFAQRLAIMYAGKIVEEGDTDTIFYRATHPYTWGLLASLTRLDEPRRRRLRTIEGNPPSPVTFPSGCRFHPRCPHAAPVCSREVPGLEVHPRDNHPSACHFAGTFVPPPEVRRERPA